MLLFVSLCSIGALKAQTVNITANKMPLDKVCKEIEKQTGYYFVYPKDLIAQQLISVDLKNAGVQTALERIFDGSPYQYKVVDKVVAVQRAAGKKPNTTVESADTLTISGVIQSTAGPLANASITTSKTRKNTLSNANGSFTLKGVEKGEMIQVTYMGYAPKAEQIVTNERIMYIYMKPAENMLDNVVVKAYGTTTRRFNTGNIVSISGKELENLPMQNPLDALEGRVPGLVVERNNNNPSAPMRITVRGRNSLSGQVSDDPLILIDGVPLTVLNLPAANVANLKTIQTSGGLDQTGNNLSTGLSPLFGMNVNEIESISVLKDADALAIYGSRGANGVILINTKKAKPGVTKVTVSASQGFTKVSRRINTLGLTDYLQYRREVYANEGVEPSAVPGSKGYAPELMVWDTTKYTDWQKYIYGGTGKYTTANLSLGGGSANSSYRISGGYNRQTALSTLSGADQTGNVLVSLNNSSTNNKFRTSLQANYITTSSNITNAPSNIFLPPNFPEVYDSTGAINWWLFRQSGMPVGSWADVKRRRNSKSNRVTSSFDLSYNIAKGLDVSARLGYMYANSNSDIITPIGVTDISTGATPKGSHSTGNTEMANLTIEPQLRYQTTIRRGNLDVLVGGTYQNSSNKTLFITNSEYESDDFLESLSYGKTSGVTNRRAMYKYAGAFARIQYIHAEKYIVSLAGRRDGSSKFGPANRYGNFGSVGLGWIITEEEFAQKYLPKALTYLKLRGSYGITGSDGVSDYQYLAQWGNFDGKSDAYYEGVAPNVIKLASNPNFKWQANKKMEIGLEWALFDQLNFMADVYDERCNNQLTGYPLPLFTGFGIVTANRPANVQNRGFDLSVAASILQTKNARWTVNFNMNLQDNKLLSYPDIEHSPFRYLYKVGETLNSSFVLRSLGIDPQTGLRMYEDADKDGIVQIISNVPPGTEGDDRIVTMDMNPRFNGGFGTSYSYKQWSMSTQFAFNKRNRSTTMFDNKAGVDNIPYYTFSHRWTYEGQTDATVDKPNITQDTRLPQADVRYQMTTLIRCSNLQVSWSAPPSVTKRLKCAALSVGANTTNLFLISNYIGIDPENGYAGGAPPTRNITFSINASF